MSRFGAVCAQVVPSHHVHRTHIGLLALHPDQAIDVRAAEQHFRKKPPIDLPRSGHGCQLVAQGVHAAVRIWAVDGQAQALQILQARHRCFGTHDHHAAIAVVFAALDVKLGAGQHRHPIGQLRHQRVATGLAQQGGRRGPKIHQIFIGLDDGHGVGPTELLQVLHHAAQERAGRLSQGGAVVVHRQREPPVLDLRARAQDGRSTRASKSAALGCTAPSVGVRAN